jgi:methylation protein EvaC
MSTCQSCQSTITPFLDFGPMPLSGHFNTSEDTGTRFPLVAALCEMCGLVQLAHHVSPKLMFTDGYTFFSSTSRYMAAHFDRLASWSLAKLEGVQQPFVVEIGCNDGTLLSAFKRRGAQVFGIDPAENAAEIARRRGLSVEAEFFDKERAESIAGRLGSADLVVATNCISHIPDLGSVLDGVEVMLAKRGLFILEEPYWPHILLRNAFDQIYDEHIYYFSANSVNHLAERHGFTLVACQSQPVHGGSMRYVLARSGYRQTEISAEAVIRAEKLAGAATLAGCQRLAEGASKTRTLLPELLRQLRNEGLRLAGYAATAKSSTLLNYCGIDRELLPWICDTTPEKQGRFSPGAQIPIVPSTIFREDPPDAALLLAWNHAAEIIEKETAFTARGGRWIVHVPEVHFLRDHTDPIFQA